MLTYNIRTNILEVIKMRKFICGVIIGAICTLSLSSLAVGVWDNISVLRNDIKVVVNGNEVTADNFLYNNTTYIPLRAVSTLLGEHVEYDETNNTAYIGERKNNLNMGIEEKYIPDTSFLRNNCDYYTIVDGHYYVSEHAMREKYNLTPGERPGEWDENTNQTSYIVGDKTVWVKCMVEQDRLLILYDTFVDEILPYIEGTN